jgi:hypothetical protein
MAGTARTLQKSRPPASPFSVYTQAEKPGQMVHRIRGSASFQN